LAADEESEEGHAEAAVRAVADYRRERSAAAVPADKPRSRGSGGTPAAVVLRVMLDVKVWVSDDLGLSRGRRESAAGQLVRTVFDGHCRLGPVQPIISHAMLDTLEEVLVRVGLPEALAEAARNAVRTRSIVAGAT
jgi:hypothetical protein